MLSELTATNLDILNSLTESLFTVDKEFRILFMNTAAEKLTGFNLNEVKGKICISAMYSMLPKIYAMMYNARFPWLKDQCVATHACPDAFNPLMYELHRVPRD